MLPTDKRTISVPLELFDDLIQVASWFQTSCNSIVARETLQNHPDPAAFFYLRNEGYFIQQRAEALRDSLPTDEPYTTPAEETTT